MTKYKGYLIYEETWMGKMPVYHNEYVDHEYHAYYIKNSKGRKLRGSYYTESQAKQYINILKKRNKK